MELQERVSQWIISQKKLGITQAHISKKWGYSNGQFVSSLKNGKGSVGLNVIKRILDFDKKINPRWLILGEGEMYSSQDENLSDQVPNIHFTDDSFGFEQLKEDTPEYKPSIYNLIQTNTLLIETIIQLEKEVRELLSKETNATNATKNK